MLEAKLGTAQTLKSVLDAIKELVTDVNFEVDEEGLKLQAMDNSHVALVALLLRKTGFEHYRCDRNMALGVNVASLQKIVRCAGNDDIVTIRAQEDADVLSMVFETKNTDRIGEYEMKLMDIDTEHLGIPDTVYDAEITLGAGEFGRIIRDLKELGESVRIEATKEGVKFSAEGDIGTASVTLKSTGNTKPVKMDVDDEEEEEEEEEGEEDDEEEEQEEAEEDEAIVKAEANDGDDEDKAQVISDDDDDTKSAKKRKAETNGKKAKKVKKEKKPKEKPTKAKKGKKGADDGAEDDRVVSISLQQSVALTFSIKYLSNFTKASPLASRVTLHMSNEVPLLVEYAFRIGYIRYYLAPKISDD